MKIALVAPLIESVPPTGYGGIERVVAYLADALMAMGHKVTLFASGDSVSRAELAAVVPEALRLHPELGNPMAYHLVQLNRVLQCEHQFDVIHFHVDLLALPFLRFFSTPHITTMHGRLDMPEFVEVLNEFTDIPLSSISMAQRKPVREACWFSNIYNGIPAQQYRWAAGEGNYLAFLGRISPEKGIESAIEIARRAGKQLRIAAKVDAVDKTYYEARIKPLIDGETVLFYGEIDDAQKQAFLGNAAALLFPIAWPEPFGLVMIEAMACGTPVIAFRRGSVPEVIADNCSGFIVDNVAEAVAAVARVPEINRAWCRTYFEQRFSARVMAECYLRTYRKLTGQQKKLPRIGSMVSFADQHNVTRPNAS